MLLLNRYTTDYWSHVAIGSTFGMAYTAYPRFADIVWSDFPLRLPADDDFLRRLQLDPDGDGHGLVYPAQAAARGGRGVRRAGGLNVRLGKAGRDRTPLVPFRANLVAVRVGRYRQAGPRRLTCTHVPALLTRSINK